MKTKFRRTPLAAALIATFYAPIASVYAQESATPPASDAAAAKSDETLPEVKVIDRREGEDYVPGASTVGGKVPTATRDIPQTVNVINRAVIESQAAASIKDALRYVPGITISAGEGGQIGDNINLRGFSARTDIYMDGFRDRGQYTRDTFFLEALEVLKGPSSMLFGRGSTGGVINQVSKVPSLRANYEFAATVGTDEYYRSTVDINQPLSPTAAARIAVMGQDLGSTRDEIYSKDFGAAPSLRFGIGTPTEVTLYALLQKNNDLPDYGFPLLTEDGPGTVARPATAPFNRFYGYTDDHFDQDVTVFTATIDHKLTPALTLRNRTQYSKYTVVASPTPLGAASFADGSPGIPTQQTPLDNINSQRQNRDRTIHDTSLFNQTDLIAKLKTGSIAHTLIGGFEIGTDEYRNDTFAWDPTNVPINLGNPVNGTRQGTRTLSSVTRTTGDTLAAYVNEQADLTEQWKVIAGLRWDQFIADSSILNYAADGTITAPAQPPRNTDDMLSTRAGVLYQPSGKQSYYASYGTSFNPSAEAVTQSANNASLDPEKNQSYEVGAKLDLFDAALSLTAAIFRIEKTNARTPDPIDPTVQALAGKVRVDGIELGAVGRITPHWQVLAGYSFLDSEIVKSNTIGTGNNAGIPEKGHRFQNTPEHQATLWTTYNFLRDFEAGAGLVYSADRPVNNFETAFIDSYTRADATLAYHKPEYELRVNLQNATDEEYFETAAGGRATPVRGRTFLFTAAVRFGKT